MFVWHTKVHLRGPWVLVLSLVIGGLLGGVMLSRVARLLDIGIPEPWGGIVASLILAATVSGVLSCLQQRSTEKAGTQADMLAGIFGQLAQAPGPVASAMIVSAVPAAVPPVPPGPEELRTIMPEQVATMTRSDWPAVVGLDDPPTLAPQRDP